MAESFTVDDRQLKAFAKDLKIKKPSQVKAIERDVLNDQAFAVRTYAINKEIPGSFHQRSKWIVSSIMVTKVDRNKPAGKQKSEVGAKKKWKKNPGKAFYGMLEQEKGKTRYSPGIETATSRSGGTFKGRVKPSLRFDRLGNIVDDSRYPSVIAMLRILERQSYKGAFRVRKSTSKIKKGIYKFKGGTFRGNDGKRHKKISMVMDTSQRSVKIRKNPWLKRSVKKSLNEEKVGNFYIAAFHRYTKQRPK